LFWDIKRIFELIFAKLYIIIKIEKITKNAFTIIKTQLYRLFQKEIRLSFSTFLLNMLLLSLIKEGFFISSGI
jgi:hypothetical protein